MTSVEQLLRPEPKRDQYDRYVINDRSWTRVTTFCSSVEERSNLELWKMRMVAIGLTERPGLYAGVAADKDDKKKINAICEDAIEAAKGREGADLGTALHTFTERVDAGENFTPPPPWDKDVEAYVAAMKAHGVRIVPGRIEQIVVNHDIDCAGTFDRLVHVDGFDLPLIADLKTGSVDHSWQTIAIQLSCYANADEFYDPATDTTSPMVEVNREWGLVIHLPAGQGVCTLYLVDLKAGWEGAQLCKQVREWRKRKDIAEQFTNTPVARSRWLQGRIENLRQNYPAALDELASFWPVGVPTFKQSNEHDADDLNLIAMAISTVEARHSVAFGDSDPADQRPEAAVIEQLEKRLAALPADLLVAVNETARRLELPNIKHRRFLRRHVADVEELINNAEQALSMRWDAANVLLDEITGGDASLNVAVFEACGSNGETWTDQQLEQLRAVRDAAAKGVLVWTEGELHCLDAEQQLVSWLGGTKREALAAIKSLAETFGQARPRSVAEAAANPVLVALASGRS